MIETLFSVRWPLNVIKRLKIRFEDDRNTYSKLTKTDDLIRYFTLPDYTPKIIHTINLAIALL